MKSEIAQAIKDLGGAPYLWQIEQETGLSSATIRLNLKGYPEELDICLSEKQIIDHFKPGMKIKELSEASGMSANTARNIVIRLSKRGIIKYMNMKYETSDGKNVYVTVVSDKIFRVKIFGAKKPTDVKLKGCGGYIIPENGKKTCCIIYKDTVPYRVRVEMSDIKIREKFKGKGDRL